MNPPEQDIVEKFQRLPFAAQRRVRAVIDQIDQAVSANSEVLTAPAFDYAMWFRSVEALREEIRDSRGDVWSSIDGVGLLRDIRDGADE